MSGLDTNLPSGEVKDLNSIADGAAGGKNFSRTPTSWDAQDDILLMHLKDQQKLGWKEIASHFTNRTPNACQFRWRRLKSGNLKNPPKSATALGPSMGTLGSGGIKKPNRASKAGSPTGDFSSGISGYSPLMTGSFTGYDNNVNSALAGLNALSNTPSNVSSPAPSYNGSGNNGNNVSMGHGKSLSAGEEIDSDIILDPKIQSNANVNNGGGYYAEISVDPTMNLPHNQPHPHTGVSGNSITPRHSTSRSLSGHSGLFNYSQGNAYPMHNNSIIQIVKDVRTSISGAPRASVSSLPSKSMNIPHHQSHNTSLAHLPIISGGSVSSSRNPSFSASNGFLHGGISTTIPSLRSGSTGSVGYYSRSGSVVIPQNGEKKEDEKIDPKAEHKQSKNENDAQLKQDKFNSKNQPELKIPWSIEEDELLINRRHRELSFAELSILLPQRTEGEIWTRIDYLDNLRNGHRSNSVRYSRGNRRSSLEIDEEDDFYDEVDDVIPNIDSEDDELNTDADTYEGGVGISKKRRKHSSSLTTLATDESFRKKSK